MPFPPPEDLSNSGIEPTSVSPELAGRCFTTKPPGKCGNKHAISAVKAFYLNFIIILRNIVRFLLYKSHYIIMPKVPRNRGLPRWVSVVKNPPANAGDTGDTGSIPGLGQSTGEGNSNPFQYSCLENPTDRGAWWAAVQGLQIVRHD